MASHIPVFPHRYPTTATECYFDFAHSPPPRSEVFWRRAGEGELWCHAGGEKRPPPELDIHVTGTLLLQLLQLMGWWCGWCGWCFPTQLKLPELTWKAVRVKLRLFFFQVSLPAFHLRPDPSSFYPVFLLLFPPQPLAPCPRVLL